MKTLLLMVLFATIPTGGAAQERNNKCGNLLEPERYVEVYAEPFYDEDAEWRKDAGIETLAPQVDRHVVTDERICTRVMHEVYTLLRNEQKEVHRREGEFQVYRIGPYYVVHTRPLPPRGILELSWIANLKVLRVDTLDYLGGLTIVGG